MCARCAATPLWVAPWPGVGSVADLFIEISRDADSRLERGCCGLVGEFQNASETTTRMASIFELGGVDNQCHDAREVICDAF